jgi:hypothetical protein
MAGYAWHEIDPETYRAKPVRSVRTPPEQGIEMG